MVDGVRPDAAYVVDVPLLPVALPGVGVTGPLGKQLESEPLVTAEESEIQNVIVVERPFAFSEPFTLAVVSVTLEAAWVVAVGLSVVVNSKTEPYASSPELAVKITWK